jgi:putative spermidine/putrescine transport system ATP-binding protein
VTLRADLSARFTATDAVFDMDAAIEVDPGETLVVLGPSGSGKTLLLETIAGFHDHDGPVSLDGVDLSETTPEDRDFGFVFQDYALFPHMTVRENVRFGERYHDDTRDADDLLAELGIADLAERTPPTLSGGEQQRVALARSLVVDPEVLLLDEPLSALDVPTRKSLREDMLDVLDDVTSVYVTHNRTTARSLADRIAVMDGGEILQTGTVADVFERPNSPFIAEFTGSNCIPLSVGGLDALSTNGAEYLAIRPEDIVLDSDVPDGTTTRGNGDDTTATVEHVVREDAAYRVSLSLDGHAVDAFTRSPPAVGDAVGVSFPEDARTLL